MGTQSGIGSMNPYLRLRLAKFYLLPGSQQLLCWGMGRSGLSVGMKGSLGGESQEKPVSPGLEKGEEAEQGGAGPLEMGLAPGGVPYWVR